MIYFQEHIKCEFFKYLKNQEKRLVEIIPIKIRQNSYTVYMYIINSFQTYLGVCVFLDRNTCILIQKYLHS